MEQQTFADGIGRITIIDGIVRMDLIAHSAIETDAAGQPKPIFAHRIVMGVDQFLRASQKITDTTLAIAQQSRRAAAEPPAAPQPAPVAVAPQPVPQPLEAPRPPVPAEAVRQAAPRYAPHEMPAATIRPQQQPQNRPQTVPPEYRREMVHADASRPFP